MSFDPNQLAALSAILRHGSFERAADELAVTQSAISQRLRSLEDQLGTILVIRGVPCLGTEAGLRLAKHARDIGLLEADLARDLGLHQSGTPPRLQVALNADSLATWFIPVLADQPDILFDLQIDDQDHSSDWLRKGRVSAAVTVAGKPVPGCDHFALGSMRYIATASPDFAARWFPDGITPAALAKAPCLVFNRKDRLQAQWMKRTIGHAPTPPHHLLPSTQGFVDAARAGVGWGMNPELLVQEAINSGQLVPLGDAADLDIALDWQVSRIMAQALAPLTRSVRKMARQRLIAP